jgi:hypothetical protein
MLSEKHSNPLFTVPLGAAATVALIVCNTQFIASKEELTPLAASAFAVAGLIAIMPWQLAQTLDQPKYETIRKSLIHSGCQMSSASLFFISAALLRYFYFHFPELVSIEPQHYDTIKLVVSTLSGVSFLVASLLLFVGIIKFGNLLSAILCE